jgi:SAM-dependent methyltransferase
VATTHDLWRQRHHLYYDEQTALLRRFVEPGLKVLEVGCGTGHTLAALEPRDGTGVDLSPEMVRRASRTFPHLRFREGNAEDLDLGGETFDVVVLSDLVGELQDVWAAFRSLRRVVRDHTRVVITYFNYLWQPALEVAASLGLKRPQAVQNWLSLADLGNLLALNGFETTTRGDRLLCPLPVPVLAPFINRVVSPLPGVDRLNLLQFLVARPGPGFYAPADPLTVSVVVPARNERGNIRPAIRRIPRMGPRTEVIFVEGGSQDGTREEIQAAIQEEPSPCHLRLVPQPGRGKGDAVRAGFAAARGDVLMILDADLTVIPEDLPRFHLALCERRGDLVNGCRLVYPMEDQAMRTLNLAANKLFGEAFTHILAQPIKDTLCGTKVLRRRDWERIQAQRHVFGDVDPFGDFDLLFGAARLGLRIVDMPVRYRARTYGSTQIQRFRHGLLLARMLVTATRHFKLGA